MMDRDWLQLAVDVSRSAPPSPDRYAVGAVIVRDGELLATGWTGEGNPLFHAEEAALSKVGDATGATLYTSLEPCTMRRSRPATCTDLILAAGVTRVVLALREPLLFADCDGVETLRGHGVEVVELGEMGLRVRELNAHVLEKAPV